MSFDPVELRVEEQRTAKALKLADTLASRGVTSDRARRYTADQRKRVGEAAGTRIPSEATWEVAVLILVNRELNDADSAA